MKNIHFDQPTFSHLNFPLQQLMELNVKTLQSMAYMKPADLLNVKKPGDLFEKNMDMFIQNTHMALNYIKDAFSLFEHHGLTVAQQNEEHLKNVVRQATSVAKETIKKSASAVKTATKKTAASAKSSASVKAPVKAASKAKASVNKTNKTAKPVVHHSKPNVVHTAHPVKHADKATQHVHAKDVGHSMPKVGGVAEKSPMKGHGTLNKGTNLPN